MSVESEILRIQSNIAGAYEKVAEKGGSVPQHPTSANLAAAVASIPAGGVTSINSLTGAITLAAGDNVSIEQDGATITISATAGGSALQSLSITTPPNKTQYKVGDTFDPAGMTATATFSDGSTILVSADDMTFSPSGPLTATDTFVTASFTFGGKTVAAQQPITVTPISIYGVEWDGTAATTWARTDDAALFTDPVPYVAGTASYSSPFDALQPWAGMTIEERAGGVMVKIPKFWYRLTQNGSGLKIQIADAATEGFVPSPAHMDRGDGKGERDVGYIGRYHCGSDFKSNSGQTPKLNTTRANFRTSIHDLGANIWQADFALRFTLWLLYLVEFADWNTQKTIGKGCGNNSAAQNMGYTDSMPYHTGTTQSNRDTYGLGTQYRNIEGLWDNCYDFTDGCYNNSNGLNIILNPNNFSDSSGGTSVGTPTSGWPSAFNVVNQAGFPMIIPSASNGGENVASCDLWSFNSGFPVFYVGGNYGQYGSRGLFFVNCASAAYAGGELGSRLQELP